MTYEQIKQQVIDNLTADWELAKSCPSEWNGNNLVCNSKSHETQYISDIEDTNEALEDISSHSFGDNYFNERTKLDTNVVAWSEDSEVEVECVDIFFRKTALIAKSNDEFNNLISIESVINYEIKSLIADIFADNQVKQPYYKHQPSCETMKLWRDKIISFEQLEQATYSNC